MERFPAKQRRKRAGSFHSRPQDRRPECRDRARRAGRRDGAGANSASSAACSARSITTNISTGSSGCATTISISAPISTIARALRRRDGRACLRGPDRDLQDVLHNANFIEIPHEEIERAHREHALVRSTSRRRSTTTARSGSSAAAITGKPSKFRNGSAGASAASSSTSMTTSSCWSTMKMRRAALRTAGKSAHASPKCVRARCCSNISATSPAPISTRCSPMCAW